MEVSKRSLKLYFLYYITFFMGLNACQPVETTPQILEVQKKPPFPVSLLVGEDKHDAHPWLDQDHGEFINIGESRELSLVDGGHWIVFELSMGQTVELSIAAEQEFDAYLFGPVIFRDSDQISYLEFLQFGADKYIQGWNEFNQYTLNAAEGGHYLLVLMSTNSRKGVDRSLVLNTRCFSRCESRAELEYNLESTISVPESLTLPRRNQITDIPYDHLNPLNEAKIELGRILFHSTQLGTKAKKSFGERTYSCASCHNLNYGSAAGAPQGIGEGGSGGVFNNDDHSRRFIDPIYDDADIDAQPIASPSILNSAYLKTALWNGALGIADVLVPNGFPLHNANKDNLDKWKPGTPPFWSHLGFTGLETQAIVGLHVHRMSIHDSPLKSDPKVISLFEEAFSDEEIYTLTEVEDCYHLLLSQTFPDTYFSTHSEDSPTESLVSCASELASSPYRMSLVSDLKASLAIAAYERSLLASESPFQRWLRARVNAQHEKQVHLTLDELRGAQIFFAPTLGNCAHCHSGPALSDGEFHVMGLADLLSSDRSRVHTKFFEGEEKGRGGWLQSESQKYAFKTPQLYNLSQRSFFGHGSTHQSIESIVRYMTQGQRMVSFVGGDRPLDSAFTERDLSESQIQDLIAFVTTGLLDETLVEELPQSDLAECIISSDPTSQKEQACDIDIY